MDTLGTLQGRGLFPMGDISQYPHLYPPPGFITVDRNSSLSLPAPLGVTTLETIQLTQGYEGWIVATGIQSSDFGQMFFTINQGLAPLRDYARITVPLGQPEAPAPLFIRIVPNVPITLTATRTVAGVVALRWRLFGWYYPQGQGS
jgi:hypothetical protein